LRFEWDDQKAVENLAKHGVSFGEATEVFYDPNALEGKDTEHSFDEARFFIIGYSTSRNAVRRLRRTARQSNPDHLGATAHVRRKEVV
jgi:uncharacterized DUF497 family protein